MLVAEAVGRTLAGLGVEHVFGVVGSGNFHVTNALVAGGARFVAARHEGGAATMADAYARVSGRVGVLSVHQGCGLTNAMTGITEAAKSRTPLVVLAAETAAGAVRSNFRIDQAGAGRRGRRGAGAGVRTGLGGRGHGPRVPAGRGGAPDRGAEPAAGRAGRRDASPVRHRRSPCRPCPARPRRRSPSWPTCSPAPAGRCSSPAAAPGTRAAQIAGAGRARAARCWPPRRWRTGSSPATRGRWTSPAASPRRWPPS